MDSCLQTAQTIESQTTENRYAAFLGYFNSGLFSQVTEENMIILACAANLQTLKSVEIIFVTRGFYHFFKP